METRIHQRRKRPIAWLALVATVTVAAALTVSATLTDANGAAAAPGRSYRIVLPTGEHVEVVAVQGEPEVVLQPGTRAPKVRILRFGGHTYVVPVEAVASVLDLSMFDIGQLARYQERMPVSLRLTGTTVPGGDDHIAYRRQRDRLRHAGVGAAARRSAAVRARPRTGTSADVAARAGAGRGCVEGTVEGTAVLGGRGGDATGRGDARRERADRHQRG